MERMLEKEEKNQLLGLLELEPNCFFNFPIMRQAYKRASKKLHPDKGGDSEKMQLLNALWHKYREGVVELRNTQVRACWLGDLLSKSLEECFTYQVIRELLLKSPQCISKGPCTCKCITNQLINQHEGLKRILMRRCVTWGECYCYFCFILWFGVPGTWDTFELWAGIITQLPRKILHLETCKYYFFNFYLK
ncbi:small t-antigen [bat polyomavirus 3b]|uniref:Small t-antigen n=1 Tax=bat polyomavirus 3b TaxID=2758136 RepID=J3U5T3_9POLY|nr:small t-antigen [bat polyomavirus 3b]AFP94212.1 small t-antigen [bat polyomavirus 3b]